MQAEGTEAAEAPVSGRWPPKGQVRRRKADFARALGDRRVGRLRGEFGRDRLPLGEKPLPLRFSLHAAPSRPTPVRYSQRCADWLTDAGWRDYAAGVRAYSMDLRERIVAAVDEGISQSQAAERFGVISGYLFLQKRRNSYTCISQKDQGWTTNPSD